MDKKYILKEYKKLYKIMLNEGIIALEDHIIDFENIPGFAPTVLAMIEGQDEKVCMSIYNILMGEIETEDRKFMDELAEEFFINNKEKFATRFANNYDQGSKQKVEAVIDAFANQMETKYLR